MKTPCQLYPFLKAVKGNWRNAIYIDCGHDSCPYGYRKPCAGFLLTSNSDGKPMLLSVQKLREITREPIDPEECCGKLSREAFLSAYSAYITWNISQPSHCPIWLLGFVYSGLSCP